MDKNIPPFLVELEKQEKGLARKFVEKCYEKDSTVLLGSLHTGPSEACGGGRHGTFSWSHSPEGERFWASRVFVALSKVGANTDWIGTYSPDYVRSKGVSV